MPLKAHQKETTSFSLAGYTQTFQNLATSLSTKWRMLGSWDLELSAICILPPRNCQRSKRSMRDYKEASTLSIVAKLQYRVLATCGKPHWYFTTCGTSLSKKGKNHGNPKSMQLYRTLRKRPEYVLYAKRQGDHQVFHCH